MSIDRPIDQEKVVYTHRGKPITRDNTDGPGGREEEFRSRRPNHKRCVTPSMCGI